MTATVTAAGSDGQQEREATEAAIDRRLDELLGGDPCRHGSRARRQQ